MYCTLLLSKSGFVFDLNRNYSPNTLALLLVKSCFSLFQSVAWPCLVAWGTSGTSQNINIMRHTQQCFNVGTKISQLNYADEIILIMVAYEFERFPDLPVVVFFFFLNPAPQRDEVCGKEGVCVCVFVCVRVCVWARERLQDEQPPLPTVTWCSLG